MKLTIFAVILLIGGIPNIPDSKNMLAGIICTAIGIGILGYKIVRSIPPRQSYSSVTHSKSSSSAFMKKHDEYDKMMARWKPIVDKHYHLMQETEKLYSEATKAKQVDGHLVQRVIELCQQDICLEEQFRQYELEKIQADIDMGYTDQSSSPRKLACYTSFKRLAIIYEKQQRYEDAIAVCQCAIEAGRLDDGTKGQMPGRMANLQKKLEKQRLERSKVDSFDDLF